MWVRWAFSILILTTLIETTFAQEPDRLAEMNTRFRAIYARINNITIDHAQPIIISIGDDLILLHKGERKQINAIPKGYHDRKAISHAALGLVVLFNAADPKTLSDADKLDLTELREKIEIATKFLPTLGWTGELLQRQEKILTSCKALIDQSLAKGPPTSEELSAFGKAMRPLVMSNAGEATALQIDATHAQVRKWRAELSLEEWKHLSVIVVGPQMPRKGNIMTQYFAKLLGEKGEGRRIIYAEALWEEAKALRLLATHQIDRKVAVTFFEDEDRMDRDLLDDAARDYLRNFDVNK